MANNGMRSVREFGTSVLELLMRSAMRKYESLGTAGGDTDEFRRMYRVCEDLAETLDLRRQAERMKMFPAHGEEELRNKAIVLPITERHGNLVSGETWQWIVKELSRVYSNSVDGEPPKNEPGTEGDTHEADTKKRRDKRRCIHYFGEGSCGCTVGGIHWTATCRGSNRCGLYEEERKEKADGDVQKH